MDVINPVRQPQPNKPVKNNVQKSSGGDIKIPELKLPKGGGAIRSIDEKLSVNPASGTATFNIPFPFSPSRNEFAPSLSLNYNSGEGNSPFGLGWSAEPACIHRRTDKQLPRYDDAHESDVFVFSGMEDLVPSYSPDGSGNWIKDETNIGSDLVVRYRPRIEGNFSRIERVMEQTGNVYWRAITKENVTSIFGKSPASRIADPDDPSRICKWLLEFSFDDKGNCFALEYKSENFDNVPNQLFEKNRFNDLSKITNVYLKNIKYANRDSFLNNPNPQYLLELVLDYGEHDLNNPLPDDHGLWACRLDPYSDYHAGFEIRTYRLCRRLLMFHNFTELGSAPCLVKSLELTYNSSETFTFLSSVIFKGFIRKSDGTYSVKAFPPMEFSYQPLGWNTQINTISTENIMNAPIGIDNKNYEWIDLYGEGISGILTEQANVFFYKSNMGNGTFTPANLVAPKPSFAGFITGGLQFQDIEANGIKSLVSREARGYFELDEENEWLPFQNFNSNPVLHWGDPNLKMLDLNGDGQADVLITEDEVFTWYAANGKEGYDSEVKVRKPADEEKGASIVFAYNDPSQTIVLADMSGDGLSDIVRIRNGEVVYWPNLGYGNFGAKITMGNAPLFDYAGTFNPAYLKLADIDGSGTTDIVYLAKDSFKVYFNRSGNSFSEGKIIEPFPKMDLTVNFSFIDLLGNGTNCLTWSSPLPDNANAPLKYIDLMGGDKPYVMTGYKNNLGKEVMISYKPSTYYYLEDKAAGTPWVTKLPFPVQCVSQVDTIDRITRTHFVNQYKYHHGYFDYVEREFRGFGMVEQTDTDNFEVYVNHIDPNGNQTFDEQLYQQPMLTKSWFHTGAFLDKNNVFHQFAQEYYQNPNEHEIAEPDLPPGLTTGEWREALRACKGIPLKVEVYCLDGSPLQGTPYTTAQHSCLIELVQPQLSNKYASFYVHENEVLTYHYERAASDPRIEHALNLEIDKFGNVLQSANIAYGRLTNDPDLPASDQQFQSATHIIYTINAYSNKIDDDTNYRLPILYESRIYELTGVSPEADGFFRAAKMQTDFQSAAEIKYEDSPTGGIQQKRLTEHVRHYFIKNDLTSASPLGQIESKALHGQSMKLAFTPSLITARFGSLVTNSILLNDGEYIHSEGDTNFWQPSVRETYDPVNFFQVTGYTDAFGNTIAVTYDAGYHFYIQKTTSPLINGTNNVFEVISFNFRTLKQYLIRDMNDNLAAVRFDELGMVIATFMMGKEGENKGDRFDETSIETSVNDQPSTTLEYTLDNWYNQTQTAGFDYTNYKPNPVVVKLSVREQHYFDNPTPKIQVSYSYSNGSGSEIMKKVQAEPGDVNLPDGTVLHNVNPRWVGNGRTIVNNKGLPVKQFEPFFSANFNYEDDKDLVEGGVTPVIYYDPLGRIIRKQFPDGSFRTIAFDAWKQVTSDQIDTVIQSQWYADRSSPDPSDPQPADPGTRSAWLSAILANTPTTVYLDSLGRNFLTILFNRTFEIDNITKKAINIIDEHYTSHTIFDIESNLRQVTDARNNVVMEYQYDMLSNKIYQKSMDSGELWLFNDVLGKPSHGWDSRKHAFRYEYDSLRRLSKSFVSTNGNPEINYEKVIFGEGQPGDKTKNLRGQTYLHYDTSGLGTNNEFDFKGNLLSMSHQLLADYKNDNDWNASPVLEAGIFTTLTTYDALNRAVSTKTPDNSIITPTYNEANFLNQVDVNIRGSSAKSTFVKNIDYDEKGQRIAIIYGNNVKTAYSYDPKTFRLTQVLTTGQNGTDLLQKLSYTYDAIGNVTFAKDDAQQAFYFNNAVADPSAGYVYDAIYRLIAATGREHIGQNHPLTPLDEFRTNLPQPGDGTAMRNYSQQYQYDEVGNILQMIHSAGVGSWTRGFTYDNASNRLKSDHVGAFTENFSYDAHGNTTGMSFPSVLDWNFKDELQHVDLIGGGQVYFTYDANGQRIRKVNEQIGGLIKERIYIGNFEIYRERSGNTVSLERETLHIMDDKNRIAAIETRTHGSDSSPAQLQRYQFSNLLGSVCLELDDQANIISYEEYYPFGSTAYQAVNKAINATAKRYRYSGMERDEETGLEYHKARYYLPWLGKWLNPDPSGIKSGINVYGFCNGNPVSYSDKDGMDPRHDTGEIGELATDQYLDKEGYYVFRDWSKAVNQGGIDSIAYNPETKEVFWIDNKAYAGRISGASALEENFVQNRQAAIDFLETQTGPEAQAALEAVTAGREVKLIANGMSGAESRATAGLFRKGIRFLDIYKGKMFSTFEQYESKVVAEDLEVLAASRGLRMTREGGFATLDTMGIVAIVGIGAGIVLLSDDKVEAAKNLAVSTAVDMSLLTLFMRVGKVGGGVASILLMVVSMESDNEKFNEEMAKQRMIDEFIHQTYPEVLEKYHYCDIFFGVVCTGWEYEVKDEARYEEIHKAVEEAIAHPYVFEKK